jgi:TRAP-type uncharacterized transport system substrate-binding protein
VVFTLLDILRDDRASLAQVHEMAGQIDVGLLSQAPIPLHPGADAWMMGGESGSDLSEE